MGLLSLLDFTYPHIIYENIQYFPFFGLVLGLIIGSFLATIVVRWPRGQSVVGGRSQCDNCGVNLLPMDLIPVISFLLQRGKCRKCGARIQTDYLVVELSAGLVGGVALLIEPGIGGLFGAVFGWLLITLAALDAKQFWLPDRLTMILAASGLVAVLFVDQPDLNDRLIGGGVGFMFLFVVGTLYKAIRGVNGLGGGDPKLLGAIGCWLGWAPLPLVVLMASTVGLAAVCMMKMRGQTLTPETRLPLGAFMGVAAFPIWMVQNGSNLMTSLL